MSIHLHRAHCDKRRAIKFTMRIIIIKTEKKKKEIFQKLRRSVENITITHDRSRKLREELQQLISEAKKKEECDPSRSYIYLVCGPPGGWFVAKIAKKTTTI